MFGSFLGVRSAEEAMSVEKTKGERGQAGKRGTLADLDRTADDAVV